MYYINYHKITSKKYKYFFNEKFKSYDNVLSISNNISITDENIKSILKSNKYVYYNYKINNYKTVQKIRNIFIKYGICEQYNFDDSVLYYCESTIYNIP